MIASRLLVNIIIISLAALVISCGSSSSDEPDPKPPTQKERDTTPDEFSFAPVNGAKPNETVTSEATRIQGFDHPADIHIENGEYRLGEGDFTDQNGEIEPDQTLTLRGVAPDSASGTTEVIVTIGGVSASFAIHTQEDRQPPQAKVQFPTVNSAFHKDKLIVRGTASDDLGAIKAITLLVENDKTSNHQAATTEDDFANWSATVDLVDGDNTITLITEDEYGNKDQQAAQVQVRKQNFDKPFPQDRGVELDEFIDMAFDEKYNRALISEFNDPLGEWRIATIDISTGRTDLLSGPGEPDNKNIVEYARGIMVDEERNRALWASDDSDGAIYEVDLETGHRKPFSSSDLPDDPEQPPLNRPYSLALAPHNPDVAYVVTHGRDRQLSKMDLETGLRTIVSGGENGTGENIPHTLGGVAVDSTNELVYVSSVEERMLEVSMNSGNREVVDVSNYPPTKYGNLCVTSLAGGSNGKRLYIADCTAGLVTYNLKDKEWGTIEVEVLDNAEKPDRGAYLHLNKEANYLLISHEVTKGLYAFDLTNNQLITLSKPETSLN